jgi:CRISPR-associated protein Csc1
MGRLYETGRLLHNIALSYALGFASTNYHQPIDTPNYTQEFVELNAVGIYVTPATGLNIQYVVNTFKLGSERNYTFMEASNVNIPSYGRAKEIAINSRFRFGVLSETRLSFPKWIRMGLWLSKARLTVKELALKSEGQGEHVVSLYPMNPLDLAETTQLKLFDLVSMRPSSLVENALIQAEGWWMGVHEDNGKFSLPMNMKHHV